MKQKKLCVLLLPFVMTLTLSACGGTADDSGSMSEKQEGNTQQKATEAVKKENTADLKREHKEAEIDETILVEQDDFKITAKELSYTGYSADLKIIIENCSDGELSFRSGTMGYASNAVNGYMISDGYMNEDVSAGKKANAVISFSLDEFAIYGITEIADIQIGVEVEDDNNEELFKGVLQVKTSAADSYDYSVNTYQKTVNSDILEAAYDCRIDYYAEDELYNQDGIRIISEALMTNPDGEQTLLLEIVNESSDCVYGWISDVSLNGLSISSGLWTSESVNPGAHRIIYLSMQSMFDQSWWEVYGIKEIGEVAFSFGVKDLDYNEMTAPKELCVARTDTAELDNSGKELFQEDGIRIVSKGIMKDSLDYIDDVHMLFLFENLTASDLYIDISYDSLSVNGFMVDEITDTVKVPAGRKGAVDVEVQGGSLEECGITGVDDITEAELTFEVENGSYTTIVEPTVSISY